MDGRTTSHCKFTWLRGRAEATRRRAIHGRRGCRSRFPTATVRASPHNLAGNQVSIADAHGVNRSELGSAYGQFTDSGQWT